MHFLRISVIERLTPPVALLVEGGLFAGTGSQLLKSAWTLAFPGFADLLDPAADLVFFGNVSPSPSDTS